MKLNEITLQGHWRVRKKFTMEMTNVVHSELDMSVIVKARFSLQERETTSSFTKHTA